MSIATNASGELTAGAVDWGTAGASRPSKKPSLPRVVLQRTARRQGEARQSNASPARVRFFFWAGALIWTSLVGSNLWGDVLQLKNGNSLEGRVTLLPGGEYQVFVDEGRQVTLPASQVLSRLTREAPYDQLHRRLAAVSLDAPASKQRSLLLEIAALGESYGLHKSSLKVYRRILMLDPHHEGARKRLGYVLYENRWVLKKALQGKGLVSYRGAWRSPEDVESLKAEEAVRDFHTLLADIHHDNKFIRENAFYELLENADPRLVPELKRALSGDDPLERMIAARVLGNHGFDVAAQALYGQLKKEVRGEAVSALVAVLGSFRRADLGKQLAKDFAASSSPQLRRNLLRFLETFPHKAAVPTLVEWIEDPRWGPIIARMLKKQLGESVASVAAGRAVWARERSRLSDDLGTGWLRR